MTRYPERQSRYEYACDECGARIPAFQGVFWFTRERERDEATIEVPYCPECGAEAIESTREPVE